MTINIYLTKEQKAILNAMSRKYELSLSTITEKLLFYITKYIRQTENGENILNQLGSEYLFGKSGYKTSIKTRNAKEVLETFYENKTKAYTNAAVMYTDKKLKNYLPQKQYEEFCKDLNKDLQKTQEPNWDYNHFIRSIKRYESKRAYDSTSKT